MPPKCTYAQTLDTSPDLPPEVTPHLGCQAAVQPAEWLDSAYLGCESLLLPFKHPPLT